MPAADGVHDFIDHHIAVVLEADVLGV